MENLTYGQMANDGQLNPSVRRMAVRQKGLGWEGWEPVEACSCCPTWSRWKKSGWEIKRYHDIMIKAGQIAIEMTLYWSVIELGDLCVSFISAPERCSSSLGHRPWWCFLLVALLPSTRSRSSTGGLAWITVIVYKVLLIITVGWWYMQDWLSNNSPYPKDGSTVIDKYMHH